MAASRRTRLHGVGSLPLSFTPQLFATGALNAIFFYWGWDVTMNLTEETRGGRPDPASSGAFWAMVNLILFFCIMMIVVLIVLTDDEIEDADTMVLKAIADKLFPAPWSYLAVVATLLSTVGTIETQLLQFSRSMFAMARDDMLHPRYAKIHPEWRTPWLATLVIWFFGLLLLLCSSFMPSVKKILEDSIKVIGFQICFYMSLACFACAWHYRQIEGRSVRRLLLCALALAFRSLHGVHCRLQLATFDRLPNAGDRRPGARLCALAVESVVASPRRGRELSPLAAIASHP